MKNLRKILAMVLVVAMVFSFAAVASAKFSDDSSIKYTTAVGVMTGIGAIDGKPDGSFGPTAPVTRAEAAKMITFAILGPKLAKSLPSIASSFSDVSTSHWAVKYIGYLVSKGIIGGRGDGTFDPEGQVTAAEMAKMLLCAVGYGKNNEYAGAAWEFNVISDAFVNEVFEDSEQTDYTKAATKEEAALYIYNVLMNVTKVTYSKTNDVYTPGSSTIAVAVYNMAVTKGIVIGGSVTAVTAEGTNVVPATINADTGKVTSIDPISSAKNFDFDATVADIGQLVKIYADSTTGEVFYKVTLSKTVANLFGVSTAYAYNNLFGSSTYGTANAIVTFAKNYITPTVVAGTPAALAGLTVGSAAPTGTFATYGGQIISFNSGADTSFEKVSAISKTAGSESISFGSLVLSNKTTSDVIKEYEGVAVGDYVTLARTGDFYTMNKVTTVEGKLSNLGYFIGYPYTYTVDGKDYNATFGVTNNTGLTLVSAFAKADFNSNTYTYYLDSTGKVVGVVLKAGSNASSVVYVTGPAWTADGGFGATVYKVQAVDNTGKEIIYTSAITTAATTDIEAEDLVAGFYKVTVDATTNLATYNTYTTADFAAPSAAQTLASTSITNTANYFYASDVKFIFVSSSGATLKVTSVTGVAAVAGYTLDATDAVFFNNTTSANKTISAVVISNAFPGALNSKVMYVAKEDAVSSDSTSYTKNVYIDGVKTALKFSNASLDGFKGRFVNYTIGADSIYTVTSFNTTNTFDNQVVDKTSGVFGNYLTVGGVTYDASSTLFVDLSQASGDPAVYTSLAALASAGRFFKIDYCTTTLGALTVVYVNEAYQFSAANATIVNDTANNGLTATQYSVTVSGTTATYTIEIAGTVAANTNIVLTNAKGPAAGSFWPLMTRTDDTHYSFATSAGNLTAQGSAYGWGGYRLTITTTLTADNTPAPTITFSTPT